MNKDDSLSHVAFVLAGAVFFGLFVYAVYKTPAWILVAMVLPLGLIASGGDLETPDQQLSRRKEENQIQENLRLEAMKQVLDLDTPMEEQQELAYRKSAILDQDEERALLLKDLHIIGVDVDKFEMMTKEQIEKKLTKEDVFLLREMRGFLNAN